MRCFNCKSSKVERRRVDTSQPVGEHVVLCRIPSNVCRDCGESTFEGEDLMKMEIQSAIVVLHDAATISGKAFKDVRHILGLKQTELAAILGYTDESISRFETNAENAPKIYRFALLGLCRDKANGDEIGKPLADKGFRLAS